MWEKVCNVREEDNVGRKDCTVMKKLRLQYWRRTVMFNRRRQCLCKGPEVAMLSTV
jgi:hypothetical protein